MVRCVASGEKAGICRMSNGHNNCWCLLLAWGGQEKGPTEIAHENQTSDLSIGAVPVQKHPDHFYGQHEAWVACEVGPNYLPTWSQPGSPLEESGCLLPLFFRPKKGTAPQSTPHSQMVEARTTFVPSQPIFHAQSQLSQTQQCCPCVNC